MCVRVLSSIFEVLLLLDLYNLSFLMTTLKKIYGATIEVWLGILPPLSSIPLSEPLAPPRPPSLKSKLSRIHSKQAQEETHLK